MSKRVQLYINETKKSALKLSRVIEQELEKSGYTLVASNADIVIGLGGDGTLLHFLRENNYSINSRYIGVNCGTLGFLQDFDVKDVKAFVNEIPTYVEKRLDYVELELEIDGVTLNYKALNEFKVEDSLAKTFKTELSIEDELLENYAGTGLMFCTPTGSTAQNLSAGGCIVHPDIKMIQITPREALVYGKLRSLDKSICIPKGRDIILRPNNTQDIEIFSDGENVYKGKYDKIRIYYSNDGMLKLTDKKYNFIKTIRRKLV